MARDRCDAACCGVLIDSTIQSPAEGRSRRAPIFYLAVVLAAASGIACGACNRPDTPPTPVVPVQPMQPSAATPQASSVPAPPPPPPPKEAPASGQPDAPDSPTAAPPPVPEKPAVPQTTQDKPGSGERPAAAAAAIAAPGRASKSKSAKTQRDIHQNPGAAGCLEMYGTCTPPPDQLCTSSAFYLDCGATGQLPSTGELLRCLCP